MLSTMRGDGSLGSWYCKTRNYYSCRRNDNNKISKEGGLEVYSDEESHGNRSIETRNSSSSNSGGHEIHGNISQEISHYT